MKILLLSCNTGQGHNTAAAAVKEALEARGVTCEMKDALSFAHIRYTSKIVSDAYLGMVSKAPAVFGGVYKAGDLMGSSKVHSPVYYVNALSAGRLGRYIERGGFDGVVCSHVFAAQMITRLKYRRTRFSRLRTYCVATDYTSVPLWEETRPDYFFIPHVDLTGEFHGKGIPTEKLVPTGIPVSPRYTVRVPKAEAREKLSIQSDSLVYLVMTGSMGFGNVSETVKGIIEHSTRANICVLVMTGRSEKLKSRIEEDFRGEARVRAIPYTSEVPLYMDAADVILTKPGGLSTTEAAVKGLPLVHTKPIPGCETKNAKFFAEKGMAVPAWSDKTTAKVAVKLAEDSEARRRVSEAQMREMPKNSADIAARFIISDVKEHRGY